MGPIVVACLAPFGRGLEERSEDRVEVGVAVAVGGDARGRASVKERRVRVVKIVRCGNNMVDVALM